MHRGHLIVSWYAIVLIDDFNSAWNLFKEYLNKLVNIHAPKMERSVNGTVCPWLTSDIRTKINSRDYILKKAKWSKQQKGWDYDERIRNYIGHSERKIKYYRNLFHDNMNKPKDFWSRIKQSYPVYDKKSTAKSFLVNNSMTTDHIKCIL